MGLRPNPSKLLQELWQNDTEPVPVDAWKVFLDAAANEDDRVWLGRARHAVLTGRFGDAEKWLGRCMDRRPDDPAVWRACLDLAVATEDGPRFWEAVGRISAEDVRPWEIAALRSWLAARSGDRRAEWQESTRLVELQPYHSRALERLAVLALEAGDSKEAERLQRRKAEIDRAKDRIHKLIVRNIDFRSHAHELARVSAVLGRQFDEHAWSLVAATSSASTQPSPGTNSTRPPGTDPDVEQSRTFCRAVSDAALARLLTKQGEPRTPGVGALARPACGPARRLVPWERPDDDHARARAGDRVHGFTLSMTPRLSDSGSFSTTAGLRRACFPRPSRAAWA